LESPNDNDAITEEVEDRLDDLFGEENTSAAHLEETIDSQDSPLRELKTIVLSIDWEITDEAMTSFVDQISVLKDRFKNDKIILVFLQLLGSLGEYIKTNKGMCHPDSFKILNSLFTQLDKVSQSKDLTESEKKKILATELAKYKALKEQLIPSKPKKEKIEQVNSGGKRKIDQADLKDLLTAIEEIKHLIKTELKALREELKSLK
jgi:hypothetical protein